MSHHKDYIDNIENAERRYFVTPVTIEKRVEEDSEQEFHTIEGHAAIFNKRADLGWFYEEILPEAFDDEVLKDDVRCLFNHSPNKILARSIEGKGTLTLSVDQIGLKYSYVTPNRSYALDLQDAIEKGDVSQSSFSFQVKEAIWFEANDDDLDKDLRQIKKIGKIFDVAPVTFPAYADAEVAKRSWDDFKAEKKDNSEKEEETKEERASAFDVFDAQFMFNQNSNSK